MRNEFSVRSLEGLVHTQGVESSFEARSGNGAIFGYERSEGPFPATSTLGRLRERLATSR